ncbi:MAG: hypothetical protein Kow00103_01990 [Candidatus Caldatribacteriota bacterium]
MQYIKIIKDLKIDIDIAEVLRYQGYKMNKKSEISREIIAIIEEEISYAYQLLVPQGIYRLLEISQFISAEEIELPSGYILKFSPKITKLLKFANHLLVGVVTIGDLLEKEVSLYLSQKDFPRALALDAVGTVAVEDFSRKIRKLADEEVKKYDLETGRHFSPGYDNWDITQQRIIFELIPTDRIGVSLTEGCMMFPRKSLSWLMGVGKSTKKELTNSFSNEKYDNNCVRCKRKSCQFRIKK